MNNRACTGALIAAFVLLAAGFGPAFGAPRIKPQVSVAGPFITYGDVFEDAGALATERLAVAPEPGGRLVLSPADLALPAQRLGLDPMSAAIGVEVTRAGTRVPLSTIEDALRTALLAHTDAAKLSVDLSNPRLEMYAPASWSGAIQVENMDYDRRSGRFTASLSIPGEQASRTDVTGRAVAIVQVPVLQRPVAAGEIIGQADIGWQEMEAPRASANTVLDPAALVGQAARRPLAPGRPLRAADVQKPVVVQKGAMVAMVVEAPGMVLTAIGRALQDGGIGDAIELTNPQSKRTIQGVVTGPGAVTIVSRRQILGAL